MQSICILGRQPALGLAELESMYGPSRLKPVLREVVAVDVAADRIPFSRLGGSIKLCRVVTVLNTASWADLEQHLLDSAAHHTGSLPEGKLHVGLSVYGLNVRPQQLQASGLKLKKAIRAAGRSVRSVPNQESALNSAQVLHNNLTGPLGWELVFVRNGSRTIFAQTAEVQNITAYARRDQARPKRDSRVGMLPPKLAQIIINLAHPASPPKRKYEHIGDRPTPESLSGLLDPFCGTGVLLQEAMLMGFSVIGSDIEPRMYEFSRENLAWLRQTHIFEDVASSLMVADATEYSWPVPFYALAAETYLGRPFSALPGPDILAGVIQDVNTIHRKFLLNVARQTEPGFRMCIAAPAWKTAQGFRHLPVLDQLTDMGYNRMSFVHAKNDELVYHRPDQVVARELVVMTRK